MPGASDGILGNLEHNESKKILRNLSDRLIQLIVNQPLAKKTEYNQS